MKDIPFALLKLQLRPLCDGPPAPHLLRGALSGKHPQEDLLHQHGETGLAYRYPLVQYRWKDRMPYVVGFRDGAKLVSRLNLAGTSLQLGDRSFHVDQVELRFSTVEFDVSPSLVRYEFVSPWIPLSQQNFRRYRDMSTIERSYELDRIVVGNILTSMRGLSVEFPGRLFAAFLARRSTKCRYKDQEFAGFLGTLVTNALIPDHLAIGRAVSHGYGWLRHADFPGDEPCRLPT